MIVFERPHRRYNQLTGEWVLVSPQRTERPWQGQEEDLAITKLPAYDAKCYLCPGNERAGGKRNPDYQDTFVFTNDFAALLPSSKATYKESSQLLHAEPVSGICRVVCFSPRHDLTLASMALTDIRRAIDLWSAQVSELAEDYAWVQVFENRGAIMGCSNPHPHCQIWATNTLPNEAVKEHRTQQDYWEKHGIVMLQEYAELEMQQQERMVLHNDHWLVVVPFWAIWPFETLLIPKRHVRHLPELTDEERDALADIMKLLLNKYNKLFNTSFPYSMGWHGCPFHNAEVQHWQLHAHYYPPLLRSATIKKFMVGYEMLAEPQRDLTAELVAQRLREC